MTNRDSDDQQQLGGVTLTLNPPFVEQYGDAGVKAYCAAVAAVAEHSEELAPSELATLLRACLDEAGIVLPDISYDRTAEQLSEADGRRVSVVLTDGTVLFGPGPQPIPNRHIGDPEDADRPTYS